MSRLTLNEIALNYPTDQSSNFHDYLGFLDELFEPLRDRPISLLEEGCLSGGMLATYSEYFTHPQARIIGMDIEDWPKCWQTKPANVEFLRGSQTDANTLSAVCPDPSGWDIIIDDAGHFARAQIEAFRVGFPLIKSGGYYIIEDLHTAWSKAHCDGPETIMQWLHRIEDELQAKGADAAAKILPTDRLHAIHSITIRKGLAVIRKA